MPNKPLPVPATATDNPSRDEETAVHEVYEAIAPHFARTRFKPWPLIERFLSTLPQGAIGLDAGAGNGKYLPSVAAAGAWAVALDRSKGLLDIAQKQLEGGAECVRGDLCDVPWRSGVFDFAISVAALHHLSTPARRAVGVQALLKPLRLPGPNEPPARFFIYVWAYEQGPNSRRKMGSLADAVGCEAPAGSERVQDVLVPWVLTNQGVKPKAKGKGVKEEDGAKGEKDEQKDEQTAKDEEPKVYNRYYHLFVEGELQDLVENAAREDGFAIRRGSEESTGGSAKWLRTVATGWEADNWWIEGEVGSF